MQFSNKLIYFLLVDINNYSFEYKKGNRTFDIVSESINVNKLEHNEIEESTENEPRAYFENEKISAESHAEKASVVEINNLKLQVTMLQS